MDFVLPVIVAIIAGAVASVAGFGIGSLLTPVLAPALGVGLAVVAVAIPHAAGTAVRFWRLRRAVDRDVLRAFGIASAAGGLVGALLHGWASNPVLAIVFALLLLLSGLAGLTGWTERVRLRGRMAIAAGALSGVFGGIVGNQGGIRSAALLAFPLRRDAFVATATATALIVDAARVPVYLMNDGAALMRHIPLVLALTLGVVAGTLVGERVLRRIPENVFRGTVSVLLIALGVWMLLTALR